MRILVVDLDGTLVDCCSCNKSEEECGHFHLRFSWDKRMWRELHVRPGTSDFLSWCNSKGIKIVVFSGAEEDYVREATNIIFSGLPFGPVGIMTAVDMTRDFSSKKFDSVKHHLTTLLVAVEPVLCAIDDDPSNFFGDERCITIPPWTKDMEGDEILWYVRSMIMETLLMV